MSKPTLPLVGKDKIILHSFLAEGREYVNLTQSSKGTYLSDSWRTAVQRGLCPRKQESKPLLCLPHPAQTRCKPLQDCSGPWLYSRSQRQCHLLPPSRRATALLLKYSGTVPSWERSRHRPYRGEANGIMTENHISNKNDWSHKPFKGLFYLHFLMLLGKLNEV